MPLLPTIRRRRGVAAALAVWAMAGLLAVGWIGWPRESARAGAQPPTAPSRCVGSPLVDAASDPALQARPYRDEPAYAELGRPVGAPVGAVLLLHGGGFSNTGPAAAAFERPEARRWLARGWVVLNASYRPCGRAVQDAEWFYDRLAHDDPGLPLCISGSSVGGSLALHLATTRPTSCVISQSGIADPEALPTQRITRPREGEAVTGDALFGSMRVALGADGLRDLIDRPTFARAPARMLLVEEANDWVVPGAQQSDGLATRRAGGAGGRTRLVVLSGASDDVAFVHGPVSDGERARYERAEDELAAGLTGPPPPVG